MLDSRIQGRKEKKRRLIFCFLLLTLFHRIP